MPRFDSKHVEEFRRTLPEDLKPLFETAPCGETRCDSCAIRAHTICRGLEPEVVEHMVQIVSFVDQEPGRMILGEGEPSNHYFIVTTGTVKIFKLLADGRRQVVGFMFPGDLLGLADGGAYAYSAEAIDTVSLCRFPRHRFNQLMESYPTLETHLLGVVNHELAEAQAQMLLLGRKTAQERVASFIHMLSKRAAARDMSENPVALPMNRGDIADYLGLTTETVSRSFTRLKDAGVISLDNAGAVHVEDPAALTAVAEAEERQASTAD